MENNCICTIIEAFKANPIPILEAGTYITPIDVHLNQIASKD